MFYSLYDFLMQLSIVYLLTAMFVILDLLLLSRRAQRLRHEKAEKNEREDRRAAEQAEERKAYEKRREYLKAVPQGGA